MLIVESWLAALIPNQGIIYWLYAANFVLAIGFAVSEIFRSRTSQGSIAWIMALLILPFPMTLVYAVFGLKSFDDYAAVQTHSGRVLRKVRAARTKILDQPSTDDFPVLANVSQLPFLAGNEVELLIDGPATFKSIFEGISRAQQTLLVQFYVIHDDQLGREFAERLIERAKAGVRIHLLYDDVGSFFLPKAYKQRLRAAGIAPPQAIPPQAGPVPLTLTARREPVACPRCGSRDTTQTAAFGATACKELFRCEACREPFEYVKGI